VLQRDGSGERTPIDGKLVSGKVGKRNGFAVHVKLANLARRIFGQQEIAGFARPDRNVAGMEPEQPNQRQPAIGSAQTGFAVLLPGANLVAISRASIVRVQ